MVMVSYSPKYEVYVITCYSDGDRGEIIHGIHVSFNCGPERISSYMIYTFNVQ